MKKSILLLSLSVMCYSFLFSQGKTDKNGLRIKKWKIYYNVSAIKYMDPLNFIPNWFDSAKELCKLPFNSDQSKIEFLT